MTNEEYKAYREKNPIEKIADMTLEMAKLVLITQTLSSIKLEKGQEKERGFAEIGNQKLSEILKIDPSRISGKNGIIQEAVLKGYLCSANVKTNEPVLDKEGNVKVNSKGDPIMKAHRILSKNMEGLREGFKYYGVEIPEKLQVKEKTQEFVPNKSKEGLSR